MVRPVHPLDVLLELVFTFKLSAARLTHKLAVLRVAQHVQLQLVRPWEDLGGKQGIHFYRAGLHNYRNLDRGIILILLLGTFLVFRLKS